MFQCDLGLKLWLLTALVAKQTQQKRRVSRLHEAMFGHSFTSRVKGSKGSYLRRTSWFKQLEVSNDVGAEGLRI